MPHATGLVTRIQRLAAAVGQQFLGLQVPAHAAEPWSHPVVTVRDRIDSILSPYTPGGSRQDFAELDAYSVGVARQMVDTIMDGPGVPAE